MVHRAIQESKKNGCNWLYKLLAAFISGGAAAVIPALSDHPNLKTVAGTFLMGAAIGAFLYLKQSPLPADTPTNKQPEEDKTHE